MAATQRVHRVCSSGSPFRPSTVVILLAALHCLWSGAALASPDDAPGDVPDDEFTASRERPFDWRGIKRDTYYFLGYQFVAVGVISLWPREDTNYKDDLSIGFESWWYNVTHPHWDEDRAVVNYVLHPYWGGAYYVRARERGLNRQQSFWYSALLSSIFEFGAEAMVEQVSYQDLVVTPVVGSVLGEYVFWPLRERVLRKEEPLDTMDHVTLALTDPLGAINTAVNQLFGVKTDVGVGLLRQDLSWNRRFMATGGATLAPTACSGCSLGWGLQVKVRW